MKTLIATHRAQELAFAKGEYLPPETLAPGDVAAAEQRHILPVVGRALYEKMLDGAYGDFVEEYLEVPVALFARLAVQSGLDVRTGRRGTTVPKSSCSQPADTAALRRLRNSLRSRARTLVRRASEYLAAHRDDFPEYDPAQDVCNRCMTDGNLVQIR